MDFRFAEALRVDCQSRVSERLNQKLPLGRLKQMKYLILHW